MVWYGFGVRTHVKVQRSIDSLRIAPRRSQGDCAGTKSQFVYSLKSPDLSGINTSSLITDICIFGRHMRWISGE